MRRTLQFVLMLAVLLTTSMAQAYVMPCCQIALAPVVIAPAVTAQSSLTATSEPMHCHGAMEAAPMADATPANDCISPVCRAATDTAAAPAEDFAFQPLLDAVSAPLARLSTPASAAFATSATHRSPPHSPHQIAAPLRV